jgi:hypothetical protein|tara:strand:- start:223 stop:636 length:414 start_codon:yes stop_codon:yes gene_type:complete
MSDPFCSGGEMNQFKTMISYSFQTDSNSLVGYAYQDNLGEISPIPFYSKQQKDVRASFKEIEKYINEAFVEVIETEETVGAIRLAINTISDEQRNFVSGVVATADPPGDAPSGGNIWFSKSYAESDFSNGLVAIAQD